MTGSCLLLISLGPVQDFIAQARRSRDLWFGSHLLSELSRAAAASLASDGVRLIFPALEKGDRELEPCDTPTRPGGDPPISIANKILAEVPGEPRSCVVRARAAVRNNWRAIARRVRDRYGKDVLAAGIDAVWNEQIEDVVEFYAVWVPLAGDYKDVRQAAEQALAGRKNLRDFRPWREDRHGAPKSSLDGARVSVLTKERDAPAFRRLRIAAQEQLDAVGLIKRAGFDPEQFVPLVNVAAGTWLKQAMDTDRARDALAAVCKACGEKVIPAVKRKLPVVEPLPFDAGVLYPSRWPALFKELEPPEQDPAAALDWGEQHVRPLLREMGKIGKGAPPAYIACLVADGDHMGKAINKLADTTANRQFSRSLAEFPREARHIVEQEHLGSLIYAGGDDVLAFLPVAEAPACAAKLAMAFSTLLKGVASVDPSPTLSVGIAVGHMLEAMSGLLGLARQAERAAKDAGRNALAIIVAKRSGGERRLVLPWPPPSVERMREDTAVAESACFTGKVHASLAPLERMRQDAELLKGALSTGKVHALEDLLRRFPDPQRPVVPPQAAALAAYATDILAHVGDAPAASLHDLGVAVGPDADYAVLRSALAAAIDRILVVRSLRESGFS
jgi:CRISPR-associated protein Cmr2